MASDVGTAVGGGSGVAAGVGASVGAGVASGVGSVVGGGSGVVSGAGATVEVGPASGVDSTVGAVDGGGSVVSSSLPQAPASRAETQQQDPEQLGPSGSCHRLRLRCGMPKMRFNHMELTLPLGTLTDDYRAEVARVLRRRVRVDGHRHPNPSSRPRLLLSTDPATSQFILLAEHREPMAPAALRPPRPALRHPRGGRHGVGQVRGLAGEGSPSWRSSGTKTW